MFYLDQFWTLVVAGKIKKRGRSLEFKLGIDRFFFWEAELQVQELRGSEGIHTASWKSVSSKSDELSPFLYRGRDIQLTNTHKLDKIEQNLVAWYFMLLCTPPAGPTSDLSRTNASVSSRYSLDTVAIATISLERYYRVW